VLYETLAGEPPVTDPSVQKIVSKKLLGDMRPVSELRPEVSAEIDATVTRALATEPAERLSTAGEFTDALTTTIAVEPGKRRKRRWALRTAAAAVVIAAGLAAWYVGWGREAAIEGGREVAASEDAVVLTRVAVFPFAVQGSPELSYLSEGAMELLGSALDGAGEVRKVDPYAVLSQLRNSEARSEVDIETARRIAQELGASHFVLGRLLDLPGTVRISTSLYSLAGDSTLQSDHAGELEELQELVNALAWDILVHIEPVRGEFSGSIISASTTSYTALRAYFRGQAYMRRHQTDSAWVEYKTAVEEDSMFALAWLGLAEAGAWSSPATVAENLTHWERAHRLRARLSPRNRAFLATGYAFTRGDGPSADRAARAMVTAYPDAAEGWRYVGDILRFHAWQLGRNTAPDAEAAYQRALALDPDNRLVLNGLALVAYHEDWKARGDSLWKRWGGSYWVPPEDSVERARYFAGLESREFGSLVNSAWATCFATDSLADATRIAGLLADPARPDSELADGHQVAAWVRLARGQSQAAEVHFDEANRLEPGMGVLERAWYSTYPFFGFDSTTLGAIRDSLVAWTPPAAYGARGRRYDQEWRLPRWLLPHAKQYVLGLLSARLGDADAAARYAEQLDLAREPADSIALLQDLALEMRALSAAERDDWEAALTHLVDSELKAPTIGRVPLFERRPLGRFLRAEALMHMGRNQEALGWYSTLGWRFGEAVWLAQVQLRQGEIYERLGNPAEAVRHYRRFVTRWRDADPKYQPLVNDVKTRIARLTAERPDE
jgi:tetratricopeptide (TPR) repeat protein